MFLPPALVPSPSGRGLEAVSQLPQRYQHEGHMHKCLKHPRLPLVTRHQAAKIAQPGKETLNHPALLVTPHLSAVIIASLRRPVAVRNDRVDAAGGNAISELVTVEFLVHDH